MSKMRVAFDHQIFVMQPYGGISLYYKNPQSLLDMNQQVRIFAHCTLTIIFHIIRGNSVWEAC